MISLVYYLCMLVVLVYTKEIPKGRDINQRDTNDNIVFMKLLSSKSNLTNKMVRGYDIPIESPQHSYGFQVFRDTDIWARGIVMPEFASVGLSNIFEFTFHENLTFGNFLNRIYRLPDHYACSVDRQGCNNLVRSNIDTFSSYNDVIYQTESTSKYGYQREVEFEASIKQGGIGIGLKGTINTNLMFANSQIVRDYSGESIKQTNGNILGLMNQWSYECSPDFYKIKLDAVFQSEVIKLFSENTLSKEKVVEFISRFGSHFYKKMITGKRFYRSIYFSTTTEISFKKQLEDLSKNKDVDYLGLHYGTKDNTVNQRLQNATSSVNSVVTRSGCIGSTICDMQKACDTNEESSSVIDYQLSPISALFSRVLKTINRAQIELFDSIVKNYAKEVLYATKPCLAVGCSGNDICTSTGQCMATTQRNVSVSFKDCDPETYKLLVGNDPYNQLLLFHERIQDICPRNIIWGYDACLDSKIQHGMTENRCWAKLASNQDAPMFRGTPVPVLKCFAPNIYDDLSYQENYYFWLEKYLWYGIYYQSYKYVTSKLTTRNLAACLDQYTWYEMVPEYSFYTPQFV